MQCVTVRLALPEDETAIFALAADFATSFTINPDTFRATFSELLAAEQTFLAIAETSSQIVGYVLGFEHLTFYANGRVAWVEEITVQADFRRKGIGTLLMQAFEQWAAERECKLVALATRRADDFYKASGYEASATYFRKKMQAVTK